MSLQYHYAAFALIRNEHGEVLFKLRRDFKLWDLPGGKADESDQRDGFLQLEETCRREVEEETTCVVRIQKRFGSFLTAAVAHPYLSTSDIYTAEIVSGEVTTTSEAAEFGWFTYQTLPENTFAIHADILRQFEKGDIDQVDLRELVKVHQRVPS